MKIKPFGRINPDSLEECYDGELTFEGRPVAVDLNFESESIDESTLEEVREFIADVDSKVDDAFEAVANDFDLGEDSEAARLYLEHHMKELSEAEKDSLFGGLKVNKKKFLDCLVLQRIGIYPEDEESYAVFDIKFPDEYSNYLMAVTLDANGDLSGISMES